MVEIDPHRELWSSDSSFHFAIFDSLVQRDDQMNLVPVLAESYQNTGPTEWSFKLRQGVKFHNGEPLDANAIKWNVEDVLKAGAKRDVNFQKFDRVEVIDDSTFKLYTKTPDPILPQRLGRFFILPPKYFEQVGEDGFIANPVGSGAYKFVERQKDNFVRIEAIDNYWRGNASIKTVTFRIIPDASTRLSALRAGEVDLVDQLPPDQFDLLNSAGNTKAVTAPSDRFAYAQFWPESPQGGAELKDKRVRQAINLAVNVDNIIKFILAGHAARQVTFVPATFFGFDPELKPYPYDPDRAKALLRDAGYPDGFSITMEVPSAFVLPKTVEIGQAIAADLAKVGIKVNVKPVELATLIKERGDKQIAPIFLWSWASDALDPEPVVRGIVHTASPYTFYGKPEWDKLIDEAANTVDQARRAQLYRQLQRETFDDPPHLFLYTIENIYGLGKSVTMTPRIDERIMVRQIQKT